MAISDAVRTNPAAKSIAGSVGSRSDFELGLGALVPAFTVVDAKVASMSRAASVLLGGDVRGDALRTLFRVVEGPPIEAVLDGTWGATVIRLEAPAIDHHYRVRAIGDVSGDTIVLLEDCTEEYRVRAQLRLSTETLSRVENEKLVTDENELLRQAPTSASILPRAVDLTKMVAADLLADRHQGTTTLLTNPRPDCEPMLGLGGNAGTLAGFSHTSTNPTDLLASLATACAVMRRSGLQDTSILTVALTLEGHHSPSLASDVLSLLRTQTLRPGQLFLELSDDDIIALDSHTKRQLDTLRRYGVGIAVSGVDDTSPLVEQLHHLAIDAVILAPLGNHEEDSGRYTRTVRRAQDRDLVAWADGVDNLEQYLRAADLGASIARGRVFDHP